MSRNAFYLHAMLGATICFVPTYHARNIFYIQKWPRNFSFLCTITSTHFNKLHLAKLSVGNIEKQIQYIKDKTVFTDVHIFHIYIHSFDWHQLMSPCWSFLLVTNGLFIFLSSFFLLNAATETTCFHYAVLNPH